MFTWQALTDPALASPVHSSFDLAVARHWCHEVIDSRDLTPAPAR